MPNREDMTPEERVRDDEVAAIVQKLTGGQVDTLVALVEYGPLDCGEVPSKVARDELIGMGCCVEIIHKLDTGHYGATRKGGDVYRKLFGNVERLDQGRVVRRSGRAQAQEV